VGVIQAVCGHTGMDGKPVGAAAGAGYQTHCPWGGIGAAGGGWGWAAGAGGGAGRTHIAAGAAIGAAAAVGARTAAAAGARVGAGGRIAGRPGRWGGGLPSLN
jgi:hypothetical protein